MHAADASTSPLVHSSFYKFVTLPDPDQVVEVLRELVTPLTGSILVAEEGISGALAAPLDLMTAFEQAVQHDPRLKGAFTGMAFKHSACTTRPFWKVRVHRKREIVALGVDGVTGVPRTPTDQTHVSPQVWRDLIARDDVVVIDNRNHFEYRLGRFKNAIDPKVDNFRDFPSYLEAQAPQWKAQGKRVAMYCTGGIRCEKSTAFLKAEGVEQVFHLAGGILKYLEDIPEEESLWRGGCFVFDERVSLGHGLETLPVPEGFRG